MKRRFKASVKNGKVIPDYPDILRDHYQSFEGKEIEITVGEWLNKRSNDQNRYLWGVVYKMIGDHIGYTKEEVHKGINAMFLVERGKHMPRIKSTTDMSTKEFKEYVDDIQRWASEFLSINIPDPHLVSMDENYF